MARYSDAVWKPIDRYKPGGSSHQAMTPQRLVLHTAVTSADSLFAGMNVPGTPVSHFYIRGDGTVEQYVDTDSRSSAVLDGNYNCVTVESWDGGPTKFHGTDGPPWTEAQLESLGKLAAWCNEKHGIPLQPLDSSKAGLRGIGWHRQGIDGNFPGGILRGRIPGGESWSPSGGKSCPGDTRIKQVIDEVIPRAKNGDDMSAADVKEIKDAIEATRAKVLERINQINKADMERDKAKQDALLSKLDGLQTTNGGVNVASVKQAVRDVFADAATE